MEVENTLRQTVLASFCGCFRKLKVSNMKLRIKNDFLTDDSEHAGGFGGLCITFIFSLIVEHRLVDDEDMLATFGDNFVLLPLSDFTSIFKPAYLRDSREVKKLNYDQNPSLMVHVN